MVSASFRCLSVGCLLSHLGGLTPSREGFSGLPEASIPLIQARGNVCTPISENQDKKIQLFPD